MRNDMERQKPRMFVQLGTHLISDEGNEFRNYIAAYSDPNNHLDNAAEQADNPREALEKLYVTLESKGLPRNTLPRPQFLG